MAARRHVLLVGLSGAGKTAAGRLAAAALGAPFTDLDEAVERRAGKRVAALFREDGEQAFRAVESACAGTLFAGAPCLVAAGAGYFEDVANRLAAHLAALTVYLEVDPAAAAERLGGDGGRPLLQGGDPAERLTGLLERRREGYLTADHLVATTGRTLEEVAEQVASLARDDGGW